MSVTYFLPSVARPQQTRHPAPANPQQVATVALPVGQKDPDMLDHATLLTLAQVALRHHQAGPGLLKRVLADVPPGTQAVARFAAVALRLPGDITDPLQAHTVLGLAADIARARAMLTLPHD